MSRFRDLRNITMGLLCSVCVCAAGQEQTATYPGIGRDATAKEVAAWDIDVRPDFKGLPPGSGSVAQGQNIWEAKCASCHGVFGESNEVFSPLVGGTTVQDIQTGHVARLRDASFPGRTTLMKVATLSTLWDYIHRAMPWMQPKSLSVDEVYAVTAYLLNLGGVVPDDFTLSNSNIAQVQSRMPNRLGMTTDHAMWPGASGKSRQPDVAGKPCMRNCAVAASVSSSLPEFARNNHGNLADQNRLVGAQRGIQTAARTPDTSAIVPATTAASTEIAALLEKNTCTACHAMESKVVGPSFADIARKYAGKGDHLVDRIRSGSSGVWGNVPMPPQHLSDGDIRAIVHWLAGSGKP